jgi:hypothetical protein
MLVSLLRKAMSSPHYHAPDHELELIQLRKICSCSSFLKALEKYESQDAAKTSLVDMAINEDDESVRIDNATKLITGSKAYLLVASCYVYVV